MKIYGGDRRIYGSVRRNIPLLRRILGTNVIFLWPNTVEKLTSIILTYSDYNNLSKVKIKNALLLLIIHKMT